MDGFILARLEAARLTPNANAYASTWLRRVSLDLTGLPPTAAEIDAFTKALTHSTFVIRHSAFAMQVDRAGKSAPVADRLSFAVVEIPPAPGAQEHGGYFRTTSVEDMDVVLVAICNGKKFPGEIIWERWSVTPLR